MASFKQFIGNVKGLQYIFDQLKVCSPLGRNLLLNTEFQTDVHLLQDELDWLGRHLDFMQQRPYVRRPLVLLLHELNDISQTVQNLKNLQVLDDIELFEVKKFAMASQRIRSLLGDEGYPSEGLPADLSKVVTILDPEESKIAHFYIYSAYDSRLAELRKRIEQADTIEEKEELTWQCAQIEDEIRQRLTEMLQPYWESLQRNQHTLATIDLRNAKADLASEWGLCRPVISNERTCYRGLFHPVLQQQMKERGDEFQAVDITLFTAPCLITGANMSGKTVLLKSLSLAQHLFQFGFYVPAMEAEIRVADEVFCVIDDQQNEQKGLSSFAVEILNINRILEFVKSGKRAFVLVDELARTTNPDEGRRLVSAFVSMMQRYQVMALVTTHYSGVSDDCRQLRVKGLRMNELNDAITPQNLSRYMDYSLVETDSETVPTEALTIARIFHADDEFLALAEE